MSDAEVNVSSPKSRIPTISQRSSFVANEKNEGEDVKAAENIEELGAEPSSENQFFSPRIKQTKKAKTPGTYIIDEEFPSPGKKGNFNQFLSKIELFQKAKNDKILCMRAIKKQQEDKELKSIPKVRMSEQSKKILEDKKKRQDKSPLSPKPSPALQKLKSEKYLSYSSRKVTTKPKASPLSPFDPHSSPVPKEVPSQFKSEKVLASKFIKEFTKTFEDISHGKLSISEDETRILLKRMLFMSSDVESSVKQEIEEKLFVKMWKITGSEELLSISSDSLKTFLLGVMNFFLPSMAHNQAESKLGKVIFNRYHLNHDEVLKVHKVFLPFYENRAENIKKSTFTQKLEKFVKMQELFRAHKSEKTLGVKNLTTKNINERNFVKNEVRKNSQAKIVAKKVERSSCVTPGPGNNNLNTSFRSARSRSRSRGPQSGRSSVLDNEWVGVNHDQISDPSILLKAQDVLGAFSVKKNGDHEVKPEKKSEFGMELKKNEEKIKKSNENCGKGSNMVKTNSQKLIFNKKNHCLNTVNMKSIDEDLKKARELLNSRAGNDDTVIDLNLPNGLHKTLVIPKGSNKNQAVKNFANDYNLSLEMAKSLLNSISNS